MITSKLQPNNELNNNAKLYIYISYRVIEPCATNLTNVQTRTYMTPELPSKLDTTNHEIFYNTLEINYNY